MNSVKRMMAAPLKIKFRVLHIIAHSLAAFGIYWAIKSHSFVWLWIAFGCFLYAGIFGVNIALHRYFSHNSFRTGKFGYWLLLMSSVLPLLGSPAAWGSIHRFHHANSDTDVDPHNPKTVGFFRSWFTAWPQTEMPLSIYRSLVKDRRVFFLDRHYFSIVFALTVVLTLIDWRLTVFALAIPAVGCFHGAAAIATIPHIKGLGGYRNHDSDDHSFNSPLAGVLSLGEGWHNNHHFRPGKYRHGEKWWEIDPSAFIIQHFLMKEEE